MVMICVSVCSVSWVVDLEYDYYKMVCGYCSKWYECVRWESRRLCLAKWVDECNLEMS